MIILTFFLGIVANFLGYIPPGNINLTVVQIAVNRGVRQTYCFLASFCAIELVLTFLIVRGAQWLSHTVNLITYIDWAMVIMFLSLGVITWIQRNRVPKAHHSDGAAIKLGILMGFMNPMQIPFWGLIGTFLISHNWILTGWLGIGIFSFGASIGASVCLIAYAKFARYISEKFALSSVRLNKAIAFLFFGLAAFQLIKLLVEAIKHA